MRERHLELARTAEFETGENRVGGQRRANITPFMSFYGAVSCLTAQSKHGVVIGNTCSHGNTKV